MLDGSAKPARLLETGLVANDKTLAGFGNYPYNLILAVDSIVDRLIPIIDRVNPTSIVIEETNNGYATISQKTLEFIHHELNKRLLNKYQNRINNYPVYYVRSSSWRKSVGLQLSKEQKKLNAKANQLNKLPNGRAEKKRLGISGKITKKHLSFLLCNQLYGTEFALKDNDITDAILLGTAFINGCEIFEGKIGKR